MGHIKLCLISVGLLCGLQVGLAGASAAAPLLEGQTAAPTSSDAGPPSETEEALLATRSTVRSSAEWLARGVDSWFGDRPFSDGGGVKDGRLSLTWLHRRDTGNDVSLRFNARFLLPNIEHNTYLYVGRDNQKELVADTPGAFSRQERQQASANTDTSFFAGVGRNLNDRVDFRLGLRGGLKPYLQARYRQPWSLGPQDLVEFRQTFFWTVNDHLGSTTALSYEHTVSRDLALRWLNAATITQDSKVFEWNSSVGAYQAFGDQRLLSLEALLAGRQNSGVGLLDYGVQTKWEQPVYRDWLIGGVVLGHFWPRPDPLTPREGAWALGASVKMKF
jgi:hypothetical protein